MTSPGDSDGDPKLAEAARRSQDREAQARRDPEPSLARRLGQIGVLGWTIVGPTILGVALGGWLDRRLETHITMTAALTFLGAGLGFWLALRWMQAQ